MCGLCGFTGEIVDRDAVLENMTEVITHRGPDSKGFYTDDKISMGSVSYTHLDVYKRQDGTRETPRGFSGSSSTWPLRSWSVLGRKMF